MVRYAAHPEMPSGAYQLTSMLPIDGEETPVGHNTWQDLEEATLAAVGRQGISACGVLDLPVGDPTYEECKA